MTIIKNSLAVVLAGVLALGSFSATQSLGADWPCFRGPNHNGISAEAITWPKGGRSLYFRDPDGYEHAGRISSESLALV